MKTDIQPWALGSSYKTAQIGIITSDKVASPYCFLVQYRLIEFIAISTVALTCKYP